MKFRELKSLLAEHGIEWNPDRGKGSHGAFEGLTLNTKVRAVFIIPKSQQREVSQAYLNPLCRKFEIDPKSLQ